MWQQARHRAAAWSSCLLVKQSEAKWLFGLGTAASPPFVSLSAAHINILWRSSYSIPKNVTRICGGKFCYPDPFTFMSPPSGAPALLLLEWLSTSFALYRDYNDSSSNRRANLSIHLAMKCSTIMASDPYFFSWKRLFPAWIREWTNRLMIQMLSRKVLCLQITLDGLELHKILKH